MRNIISAGAQLGNLAEAEAIIVCMTGMASRPENDAVVNEVLNSIVSQAWPSVQVNLSICALIKTFATNLKQE
jgi:hypothetical protein